MKIYKFVLLIFACISPFVMASNINEENISIGVGSRVSIDSKILGEARNLLVHLPGNYAKSNKSYPVLYLLDGERHFNHAIIATRLLQEQEKIPELIIVAIPNIDGETRTRDLNREKDNFTLFIKNEVMSYIDKSFRTTGQNTLYGHSLAGYFTVSLLVNQPDIFERYIAASPPLQANGSEVYNNFLIKNKTKYILDKSLYFTSASQVEEGERVTQAITSFVKLLTEKAPEKLSWRYELLADETHITTYYLTLFKGMTHVFKNYQASN